MNGNQIAEKKMGMALSAFFMLHPELTTLSHMLGECVANLDELLTLLEANIKIQNKDSIGIKEVKVPVRRIIDRCVWEYGRALTTHFVRSGSVGKVKFIKEIIKGFCDRKDEDVYRLVVFIHDIGIREALLYPEMRLSVQQFTDLKTHAATFNVLAGQSEVSDSIVSEASANIGQLLKEIKRLNNKQIIRFIDFFRKTHPELVALYEKVSVIDYPRSSSFGATNPYDNGTFAMLTYSCVAGQEAAGEKAMAAGDASYADLTGDMGKYFESFKHEIHQRFVCPPEYTCSEWTAPG